METFIFAWITVHCDKFRDINGTVEIQNHEFDFKSHGVATLVMSQSVSAPAETAFTWWNASAGVTNQSFDLFSPMRKWYARSMTTPIHQAECGEAFPAHPSFNRDVELTSSFPTT
jgi:hypothetical protein